MEDWELSAEELDSLERDALNQIAHRNSSSSSYCATTSRSNINSISSSFAIPYQQQFPITNPQRSPLKPNNKVLFLLFLYDYFNFEITFHVWRLVTIYVAVFIAISY